jgi:hypothetical protein
MVSDDVLYSLRYRDDTHIATSEANTPSPSSSDGH